MKSAKAEFPYVPVIPGLRAGVIFPVCRQALHFVIDYCYGKRNHSYRQQTFPHSPLYSAIPFQLYSFQPLDL